MRQHGRFQQETAAKGCWIPLLLFTGSGGSGEGARRELGAGSIPHPLVQRCHVQGQGLTVASAEQGPGSLSHPHWNSHILEGDTHQDGSASSVGTLQLQK